MLHCFRATDKAIYTHNYLVTLTLKRGYGPTGFDEWLVEHFRNVDNYGLDKIRAIKINSAHGAVTLVVAIPSNRNIAPVVQRLKGASHMAAHHDFPRSNATRSIWQRGYKLEHVDSASMDTLRTMLTSSVS